tara:strand:+ start:345 stop:524 length:180 start_codon:yes stop_codon:yes gene_type:complete
MKVKVGNAVLIEGDEMLKIISMVGGSRDLNTLTLFQVASLDTGEIKFVHAAEVRQIFKS